MSRDLSDMFYPHERRDYMRRDHTQKLGWKGKLLIAGLVLFVLAYAYQALALTPEYLGAEVAHAEEIHQNDYYCERIKRGYYPNAGSSAAIEALCAKWGVNLND